MLKFISIISILFSLNSFAGVQFEKLDSVEFVNPELRSLVDKWEREFAINDAGACGFQVHELNESGRWDMTVRNIFYITNYCHDEKEAYPINNVNKVHRATKRVIEDMAYLEIPESSGALDRLASKYSEMIKALYNNPNFIVFDGYSACDSLYSGHSEIAIIDKQNKQYAVLFGGYSK